jgi:hypothetical protein
MTDTMTDAGKKKELKLVRDETQKWRLEGYQKLDEGIVLYRRYIPVTKELNSILIQMYDFTSYQMTVILDAKGYNSGTMASAMQVIPFADVGNKQALRDAHQALVELGGDPPPFEQVIGIR